MDAARAQKLVRRWWWLMAIGTVMAVAAYGISVRVRDRHPAPPVYAATATLFVSPIAPQGPPAAAAAASSEVVDRPWDMDRLLATYALLIGGRAVSQRIVDDLALDTSAVDIRSRIAVSQPAGTQLLTIVARGASAEDADRVATAAVRAFDELRAEQALPGDVALYDTTPAAVEANESSDALSIALVALAGLAAAAMIVLAFEYVSDAVRDAREAEAATELRTLAVIPRWDADRRAVAPFDEGDEPAPERYRLLRTNAALQQRGEPAEIVVFAGARRGAGTSTTAANYAASLAHGGRRVVLVDGDLRHGKLGARFDVDVPHGLADALALDLPVYGLIDATEIDGLSLIAAGQPAERSPELLESSRFAALLADLRERFDAIVIDAPPLLEGADATLLASQCDAAVLVLRCERTSRTEAAEAAETLRRAAPRVLGSVLNDDPLAGHLWLPRLRVPGRARRESEVRA